MIESDIIEDQNDARVAYRLRRSFRVDHLMGMPERQTNRLCDEAPDENSEEARDRDQGEESDRAERSLSRRDPASPLPSSHARIHFRITGRAWYSPPSTRDRDPPRGPSDFPHHKMQMKRIVYLVVFFLFPGGVLAAVPMARVLDVLN